MMIGTDNDDLKTAVAMAVIVEDHIKDLMSSGGLSIQIYDELDSFQRNCRAFIEKMYSFGVEIL